MSKVTQHNGENGTSDGMFLHRYSGGGTGQYEWPHGDDPRLSLGDTFVMNVRVELTKVITDEIADGQRQILGFKVVDSAIGKLVEKSGGIDPAQTSIDDMDDSGGYDDYQPPAYQPPLDEPAEPAEETDGADHAHPFKVV